MPVSPLNESKAADVLRSLDESPLPGALKEDLRTIVRQTADATNGMTPEEKTQALSQGVFDIARLMVYNMIHEARHPTRSWKDVIVECRRTICVLAGIIAGLLIIRPEIAEIAYAVSGHPPAVARATPPE